MPKKSMETGERFINFVRSLDDDDLAELKAAAARALGGAELLEGAAGEIVVLALEVPFGVENLLRGD